MRLPANMGKHAPGTLLPMLPPLIPREVLFGNPTHLSPGVSPDGRRLAYLAPDEGVLNLWVGSLHGGGFKAVTRDRDRGIRFFMWAHDNRHLLYLQDRAGDEDWHLNRVDLTSSETVDLTPFEGVQARVAGASKHVPGAVLVGLNRRTQELHDLYRADLSSGELTLLDENPGFAAWRADLQLRPRAALETTDDACARILVRDQDRGPFRTVHEVGPEDALQLAPLSFDAGGRHLYLLSSKDANTVRLLRLDASSGKEEVVFEDPEYDVVGVVRDPDSGEPQIVSVLRERIHHEVLDPTIAGDMRHLEELGDGEVDLIGRDHADRVWLVQLRDDDGPIRYFVHDRSSHQSRFLFSHRPELEDCRLAPMEPFSFRSRDGLTIHGYLTFPPGTDRKDLPTVLFVHGGPWARDVWGFNPVVQWLANRGYLCVQVNYRGSTGYGKAFLNAGDREWGARMHDDLLDGVEWVVGRGYADRSRVAIYGGSYGGYAALAGAAFTPDVFRCAVDIVGPSNLRTLIATTPPYWRTMRAQLHRRVGDPEQDADFLWSRSPLSRADQIQIPLLIAQGANDPRVKQAESEQIVAALRAKDIPYEYLLFPDEGHGFAKPENRLRFQAAAERFLAQHLGGRFEP